MKSQFWVAFLGVREQTPFKVKTNLKNILGMEVGEILRVPDGYEVACKSEDDIIEFPNFHEFEIDGRVVQVNKFDRRMRMQFVSEALKDQDDLARLVASIGTPEKDKYTPKSENVKPKGGETAKSVAPQQAKHKTWTQGKGYNTQG